MFGYVANRIAQAVITLWGISLLVFALARLSGDAASILIPPEATEAQREELRRALGLDKSMLEQYWIFLTDIVKFDFGNSYRFGEPALEVFWSRLPATLELSLAAAGIALSFGVLAGVLSAVKDRSVADRVVTFVALMGQAIPSFVVGILMIMLFAVELEWLPTSGRAGPSTYILPSITLAWFSVAALTRMTKSSMLDVMDQEYIRLARLKGLPERVVIWKHAFRNACLPILTLFSLQLIFFVSGSVITESIFAWPGLGQLTIQAISARDYPLVQCVVFLLSAMLVIVNLVVDLSYALVDPRVRVS